MPRPKIHDEKLRVRLLRRAGAIVSADGLDRLSLRTLATDCETSTTAVYSLFGGKTGLLTELFDEAFRRLGRHLAQVRPGADALDDLVRMGQAYRDSALDDPHLFAMMFTGRTRLPAEAEGRTVAGTALGPLREAVERAVDEKVLRPDTDAATASLVLWTTVHGWASLQLRGFLPPGADGLFDVAVRAVLDGWRPAGFAS
ncbi:TetR/AcrR family transcriptional regulator [Pseudonocardia sp. GCM10023141]|uniref:TetR/AcrR family transcriptional regulator n=1 Tax=Pseudonocardia sp. GCM10023141 TaxID=3252653 RepID=UPI00361CF7A4